MNSALQPELPLKTLPPTKVVRRYLHHESDEYPTDLWPMGEGGGPRDEDMPQHERFHYALYEVAVDLEVDLTTGKSRILRVDDVPLAEVGDFK